MKKVKTLIEELEIRKQFHLKELSLINVALSAINKNKERKTTIKWTKEILKVFSSHNGLLMNDICLFLFSNGVIEATDKTNRNTIQAIVHRLVKKRILLKNDNGVFNANNL
jgi:hypothetical protein